MPQTLQQQYSAALIALGAKEVPTTRGYRSYKTFSLTLKNSKGEDETRNYYLGKLGSVRRGRIYTESVPLSDAQKMKLLELGWAEISKDL